MSGAALGIDVGLTGARAALVAADGRIVARSRTLGSPTEDPRGWYQQLRQAVAEVRDQAPHAPTAIVTVAGAGCRPVLVDEQQQPLLPARLAAHDHRTAAQRAQLAQKLGVPAGELADHAAPTLLWWREHEPDAFRRAALVVDTTGLLVGRLTALRISVNGGIRRRAAVGNER